MSFRENKIKAKQRLLVFSMLKVFIPFLTLSLVSNLPNEIQKVFELTTFDLTYFRWDISKHRAQLS